MSFTENVNVNNKGLELRALQKGETGLRPCKGHGPERSSESDFNTAEQVKQGRRKEGGRQARQ